MGDRKGDARIYLIYVFFFASIIGGGVFLSLYLVQPHDSQSTTWYVIIGMTLVSIPWFFWFLLYLYTCFCFGTHDVQFVDEGSRATKSPPTTSNSSSWDAKSPLYSPIGGGEHRVHFGVVVEMGDEFGGGDDQHHHHHHEDDVEKLQL
ncbi:unnamed protein product [Lupinus luteus]|uniref:Transmembrane protein n=1 Tax=Lupinus luteus TaxID=3873 RepID=A0AAV1XS12_LUPLU